MACKCKGIPEVDIRKAVKDGARTVEDVAVATPAGTGCGTCAVDVEALIVSEVEVAFSPSRYSPAVTPAQLVDLVEWKTKSRKKSTERTV